MFLFGEERLFCKCRSLGLSIGRPIGFHLSFWQLFTAEFSYFTYLITLSKQMTCIDLKGTMSNKLVTEDTYTNQMIYVDYFDNYSWLFNTEISCFHIMSDPGEQITSFDLGLIIYHTVSSRLRIIHQRASIFPIMNNLGKQINLDFKVTRSKVEVTEISCTNTVSVHILTMQLSYLSC